MQKWYDKAVFYHIYPLGLTGAPKKNEGQNLHKFDELNTWIAHLRELEITAIYIGPLFQSVGHGYETTDYKLVDTRLGTNKEFQEFVTKCHENGIRVVVDGVFNHSGRKFFAFEDLREKRESSRYKDWYCNVKM